MIFVFFATPAWHTLAFRMLLAGSALAAVIACRGGVAAVAHRRHTVRPVAGKGVLLRPGVHRFNVAADATARRSLGSWPGSGQHKPYVKFPEEFAGDHRDLRAADRTATQCRADCHRQFTR
jgi:hypothetical protein